MCGIAGYISFEGPKNQALVIKKMTDAIAHRGPDGDGFVFFSDSSFTSASGDDTPEAVISSRFPYSPRVNISETSIRTDVALGHRRLSIIDLSPAGHQPMCDETSSLWITFNGEIYNYPELREELKSRGHQFITASDTEVILCAFREWKDEMPAKLNGMFSFVIYDREKKEIFAARDRFGVKPFYYHHSKSSFLFASEQKSLLSSGLVSRSLNERAIADYFVSGEIEYREEGFFRDIKELFPSSILKLNIKTGNVEIKKYASLSFNNSFEKFSEEHFRQHVEEVREFLVDAVRIRLRSDVTVGTCLSGGIDSSAIAGIIHHLHSNTRENLNIGDRLNVYTAVFPGEIIDESTWAEKVVKATGAKWHKVETNEKELLAGLEELMYSQDVPLWSTSTWAQHSVMKKVKETGVRVVLDGQGGDELFAGYDPYYTYYLNELSKNMRFSGVFRAVKEYASFPAGLFSLGRDFLKLKFIRKFPAGFQLSVSKAYFEDLDYVQPEIMRQSLLSISDEKDPSSLNEILHKEFVNSRLKGYLKCEDRCAMWHSVESRTPFADDHRLIGKVFSIPGNYKIHGGINKFLLREAVRPFVPNEILDRRDKKGYATPNHRWIAAIRNDVKEYFTPDLEPFLNVKKILKNYDELFNAVNKPDNGRLFKLISFAVWKKNLDRFQITDNYKF